MDGFFPRLGGAVARYRWLVIGVWVALLVASVPGIRNVTKELKAGGYELAGTDSGRGAAILDEEFGRRTVTTGVLVFASDSVTIDDPANSTFRDAVNSSIDRVSKIAGVRDIISFPSTGNRRFLSADRKTTYAILNFSVGEEESKNLTVDVRDQLEGQPGGIKAHLMGFPSLAFDLSHGSDEDLHKAELYSMPVTLVLLLLVFGTLLAAGLPLVLGACAVGLSFAGIYIIAQHSETSIFAKNVASMIGLGLGIDFSLLMVSRFREELDKGISVHQATVNTVATSGRSIVFSGLTVMVGLSILLLYKLTLIRSIALGMLLVAGIAMLGAITLLPALMALFGRKLNAFRLVPKAKARAHGDEGKWHRWSIVVMGRPWIFLILTVVILLALAYPARELNAIGTGSASSMPEESPSRKAFEALLGAFGAGEATPIQIVVRTSNKDGAWDPNTLEGVYRLVKQIETDPRVARVESLVSVANAAVPNITEAQFKGLTLAQLQANPRIKPFLPSLVNVDRNDDTHSIVVFSKQEELDADSIALVKDLRKDTVPSIQAFKAPALQQRCGGDAASTCTGVYISGQTSLILDYRDALLDQFPLLVGLVLIATYLVLLLFFHSLILPLKAILMNVVSILASYGVLVLVFQHGVGDHLLGFDHLGRLSMFSPVILFSILFGLSTDYEVFLLSRVKELYSHSKDNDYSVASGLEHTAGTITAAGMIMIVVFGSFALGSTIVIKELGVGLAVAVLLDSSIIRIVMVPASMKLMGAWNWWMPKFLDWIPTIKESADLPGEAPRPASVPAYAGAGAAVGFMPCPVCRTPLRSTARFCGRCGTRLERAATQALPVPYARPEPVPSGSVRRVPVVLVDGPRQQRAWLVLRDCQVEDNPGRSSVPQLQINGLDVGALRGSEPEIQIRNARIRM